MLYLMVELTTRFQIFEFDRRRLLQVGELFQTIKFVHARGKRHVADAELVPSIRVKR